MPDIIKQLEEGKKIQEEQGIDADSLRTKLETEEESTQPKKRGRKKKEKPVDSESDNNNEQLIKEDKNPEPKEEQPQKPVENPDFDFNNYYEKDQIIFYIKINKALGTKDFYSLKIRTIYPRLMVACEEGKAVQCIGYDSKDMIFTNRTTAKEEYDKIEITPRFALSKKTEKEEEDNGED